jgi:hypothetical protein
MDSAEGSRRSVSVSGGLAASVLESAAHNGVITTFDVPGAGTGTGIGTIPISINPAGAIVGFYFGGSNVGHGFPLEGE